MKLFGKEKAAPKREEFADVASIETMRGQRSVLPPGPTIVGRTNGPDLGLENDEQASRRHAAFEVSAAGVRLRDLDSRNGTFVNGEWISVVWLKNNDRIKIGETELVFRLEPRS